MTNETIIKSALKGLVKMQIEEGGVGFAVDNDHDHDCCWDDVLAWIEAQPTDAVSKSELMKLYKEWQPRLATNVYKFGQALADLPPVTPQASEEDIHREREQAYMLGYEDASKKFRTEPCEDCVSRQATIDAIYKKHVGGKDAIENAPINDLYACGLEEAVDAVEDMPSVTPQTVTEFADKCKECGKIQNELYEDAVSREDVLNALDRVGNLKMYENCDLFAEHYAEYVRALPSVKPKYTDEEIDRAQAVEQAYVDKMVELAVEESRREWLNSFDTDSATKCFEAVNLLKQRLEGDT